MWRSAGYLARRSIVVATPSERIQNCVSARGATADAEGEHETRPARMVFGDSEADVIGAHRALVASICCTAVAPGGAKICSATRSPVSKWRVRLV